MIKHIVCWKVVDRLEGMSHEEILQEMKKQLESLPAKIIEIKGFEVGINQNISSNAYDISLYSTFDTKDDLSEYASHPEHVKVGTFIKKAASKRVVVDYEI